MSNNVVVIADAFMGGIVTVKITGFVLVKLTSFIVCLITRCCCMVEAGYTTARDHH